MSRKNREDRNSDMRTREMAQELRALAALAENPDSVPNTHMGAQRPNNTLFLLLSAGITSAEAFQVWATMATTVSLSTILLFQIYSISKKT